MSAREVRKKIESLVRRSTCTEKELYDELVDLASGWQARLDELEDVEDENE